MSRIPLKIGKYQIEEKIAEGGMGAVFKGTHPTLEKPVVLKKLTMSSNEQLIERFRREAKIMMEFSNENIVRVYDHFKSASAYYIVQELVDGKSVDILLKKERYLRYEEALYIFYFACKALDYAHKNQVVHRDIKPANILVSKTGEIKLVDFGIAQSEEEEESLTKEGMSLGTPSYMAPEQYDDSRNVTYKADIYSLGIMLYEMVTGKKPFPGKLNPETLLKIQKGKYTPPRKVNPILPGGINWYMKKCIQPKPQKRAESVALLLKKLDKWYQSADIDQIRTDLIRIVNGEERSQQKSVRKKSGIKWIIPAVLIVILLGSSGFLYWKGFHYRTIYAARYGGFRISQQIKSPQYPLESYILETSVFPDERGKISDDKIKTVSYSVKEIKEDGSFLIESPDIFIEPGSYWLKTSVNEKVYWQNIFMPPFSDRRILFKPAPVRSIILDWPAAEKKPLTVIMNARSRQDGNSLNSKAVLTVEVNNQYLPLDKLKQKLTTGKAYNFKVEAEGFYPVTYDLGIKVHQDQLILNPSMIPLEGFLRLKSSQQIPDSTEILINGKSSVLPGGLGSDMIISNDLSQLKSIPLNPGKYTIEIKIGKIQQSVDIVIDSQKEKTMILELINEKNKLKEISIKE